LTFDDGYREWSELVAPSLRAADATATFFVTAGLHRGGRPHAIDAYYWLLDHAVSAAWEVTLPDGQPAAGDLRTIAGKQALVTSSPIKRAIVTGNAEVQAVVLAAVAAATRCEPPHALAAELYMEETRWRSLALAGTIGAHGVKHRPWTLLDDRELRDELLVGREVLVAATGASVEFVAYPDGACDSRVAAATRAAGYRAAVLAGDGEVGDLFALPRVFRRMRGCCGDMRRGC
jgi:peptidoglycan/xylan/chitin deacetylase (PgdA/CDA1 family)